MFSAAPNQYQFDLKTTRIEVLTQHTKPSHRDQIRDKYLLESAWLAAGSRARQDGDISAMARDERVTKGRGLKDGGLFAYGVQGVEIWMLLGRRHDNTEALLAYAVLSTLRPNATLHLIAGVGYARFLHQQMVTWAATHGVGSITVDAMTWTVRTYEHWGYRRTGKRSPTQMYGDVEQMILKL